MTPTDSTLTREVILAALQELSDELGKQSVMGEICLFGGTVMVLAFNARVSTKDVDAVFQPAQLIRSLAQQIGERQNISIDWLNDGVKGYLSERHEVTVDNLPQFANLRLTMPVAEYMLAMKCMASRVGRAQDEPSDVADIQFLIRHLGLSSAIQVLDLVGQYYPPNRIPVKTKYLVDGLFDEGSI